MPPQHDIHPLIEVKVKSSAGLPIAPGDIFTYEGKTIRYSSPRTAQLPALPRRLHSRLLPGSALAALILCPTTFGSTDTRCLCHRTLHWTWAGESTAGPLPLVGPDGQRGGARRCSGAQPACGGLFVACRVAGMGRTPHVSGARCGPRGPERSELGPESSGKTQCQCRQRQAGVGGRRGREDGVVAGVQVVVVQELEVLVHDSRAVVRHP